MIKETITLDGTTPGMFYQVTALKFGSETSGKKIYLQASLHGDELPGSLVSFFLHQHLLELEKQGRLKAQIVLVPYCNPIGLGQATNYHHIGRFNLITGQNFNRLTTIRLYQELCTLIEKEQVQWSDKAADNTVIVRGLIKRFLDERQPVGATESLHLTLLRWAYDADLVLDLHCDNHAVLHTYTTPEGWSVFEPLARYLGSRCQIISPDSGTGSFDEVLGALWLHLKEDFPTVPFELATLGTTVEFRGENDLDDVLANQDAVALLQFLNAQGYVDLPADATQEMPPLITPPHPLEGLCYIAAPNKTGIVAYQVKVGDWVEKGQVVALILNPITLEKIEVKSPARGIVFAQSAQKISRPETKIMSISSPDDQGGQGLSP